MSWVESNLKDLVDIKTGKKDANEGDENGTFRFYTCARDYSFIKDYAFDEEAILISGNGAYVGYVHYYNGKFDAYQRTYILSNFKVDVFFLFHYLGENLKLRIHREKQDGATPYIKKGTLAKFKINYPKNPAEQTAIATILSKVDEAIEATQKSIKAAEKLKKALMQNLLTGKLKPDGTWRSDDEFYVDEKFGKVPKGWEVKRVKDVFEINQKSLPSQTNGNYKFRYITIEAVNTENIDFENCPEYLFKESPGRARRIMIDGDILISGVRPNLKAFVIYERPNDENWICSTGFYVLTAKEDESNKFYFYQILSEMGEKQFHSYVAGSNYPAIGDRDIKNMKLLSPQYDEQLQIEDQIGKVSQSNQQKQTKIRTLQRLKKSLMQNLLTGKVRLPQEVIERIAKEDKEALS